MVWVVSLNCERYSGYQNSLLKSRRGAASLDFLSNDCLPPLTECLKVIKALEGSTGRFKDLIASQNPWIEVSSRDKACKDLRTSAWKWETYLA